MAGVVDTTNTFATNEVITSTLLNNIIDQTLFTSDALSGGTLALTSGKMKVATSGITSNEMAVNAVTANAITDGVITNAKISASAAIGLSKLATGALPTAITIASANIVDANVTASKLSGGQTGSPPIYGVRAWGRFDGTGTSPISPVYGGNIASVTRTSLGIFAILFTTPMTDANYSVVASGDNPLQSNGFAYAANRISSVTANGFTISFLSISANPSIVCFQVIQ